MSDEQEEDFATMFEASVKARQFAQGQTIDGTIVAIGAEVAFISVGGKSEAQIPLAELKDDAGHVEVSVGDRIQARVVSTSGGITLSRKGVRNAATQRELENAFAAGAAVENSGPAHVDPWPHRAEALRIQALGGSYTETAGILAFAGGLLRRLDAGLRGIAVGAGVPGDLP